MLTQEQLSQIRSIEILARKRVMGSLLGDYRSSVLGSGFEFHQLREYAQGDDIRFIDWSASARTGTMLVRQFKEERNRTVYLALDISASTQYGSTKTVKAHVMKELAALLAFVSHYSKDAVGLLLFSNEVEVTIAPGLSRAHIMRVVATLLNHKPLSKTTNLQKVLEHIARLKEKSAIVCLISDFMASVDQSLLRYIGLKHDLLLFRCLDPKERSFPAVGALQVQDTETDVVEEVMFTKAQDTFFAWHTRQEEQFLSAGVDHLDIVSDKPYVTQLIRFLSQRMVV